MLKERKEFTFTSKALPEDTFSVVRFSGIESLSRPYEFDITLASQDPEIDLKAVLQNPATLTITHTHEELPFHGVLAGFEQLHEVKQHAFYRAILVPKLWNAGLYHENQIFLDKTVPQIIEEILKQAGMAGQDYELNLTRNYPSWEHICQYQETDLDFISRWMEREGIYYFFEQAEKGVKMVVSDNLSIHKDIQGDTDVPYSPPSGLIASDKEIVNEFSCRQKMLPAKVILKDHNYRKPGLEVKAEAEVDPKGRGEVYVYGEHFKDSEQGKELAKIRAEELLCREREFHGEATAPALSPGYIFELSRHYRSEYNRRYLIVEVTHKGSRSEDLLAGLGNEHAKQEEAAGYSNRFVCIPADVQFRPERRTEKPKFYGTMNAFVDAAGDGKYAELDDRGRYKVILPYDLSGRKDGKASRFIRMAQPYSGFTATDGLKEPSGMHFPLHKGAEVLLTFVDGDPDRPIINSAVPNPATVSPVINANQTQSVIRDNYGNELIFDSTPGAEHIRLYSPHHSSALQLGKSVTATTQSDDKSFIGGNKASAVVGNFASVHLGSSADAVIGLRASGTLGGSFNLSGPFSNTLNCGMTWDCTTGLKIESTLGEKIDDHGGDFIQRGQKRIVLDAQDDTSLIGGYNDRSIIRLDNDEILLSFGVNPHEQDLEKREGHARRSLIATNIALALMTGFGAAAGSLSAEALTLNKGQELFGTAGTGAASALSLIAAASSLTAWRIFRKEYKVPEHDNTFATVKLKEDGIEIKSAKKFNARSKDAMFLYSDKNIYLSAPKGSLFAKGSFKHKNFTIMA